MKNDTRIQGQWRVCEWWVLERAILRGLVNGSRTRRSRWDNHSVSICDDYRRYRLRFATACGRVSTAKRMRENAAPATPLGDRRYCFLPSEKVRYSDNYRFDRLSFRIDVRSRLSHCCSRFVPEFEPIAAVYRLRVPNITPFSYRRRAEKSSPPRDRWRTGHSWKLNYETSLIRGHFVCRVLFDSLLNQEFKCIPSCNSI